MKKLTFLLVLFFILVHVRLYSQPYGWFSQNSGTSNNLNGVYFASNSTGIVVGQSGTVIRTTNGGTNWSAIATGTGVHLFGVFFIDANTGWAVGDVGVIIKTTNGGLSWTTQSSGVGYQLRSVSFRNSSTGYVTGWYGTFLRTTNGGTTWVSYSTGLITNLNCVSFADANVGFAAGQFGKIVRTTNAGVNWSEIPSGTASQIEQVSFTGLNDAVIIGEGGFIRKTTNMGVNWTTQTSGTGNWLNGMTVKTQNFYLVTGDYGTIRKTSNGGVNWYQQTSNTNNLLNAISFVDTNTGWAVGINGTIIKTTTGGWLLPGTPSLSAPSNGATCFSMTGLLNWNDIFPPVANYWLQVSLSSTFASTVLDITGLGLSEYTLQTGQLNYNTLYYWRVKAVNQVGEGSWSSTRNFRTTTPAVTAPVLQIPADNASVYPNPLLDWDSVAAAVTYRCRIATDTGFTNTVLDSSGITLSLLNVPLGVLQANTRYYWQVSGINSCITGPYSPRRSFFTDMITGVNLSGTEIPKTYELYTNYPNPFNPFTSIRFDLPKDSRVNISVFNILGEEIQRITHDRINAGRYSYLWDGSAFASGVYFYRIEAFENADNGESFVRTKKMILVK